MENEPVDMPYYAFVESVEIYHRQIPYYSTLYPKNKLVYDLYPVKTSIEQIKRVLSIAEDLDPPVKVDNLKCLLKELLSSHLV